MHRQPEAAFGEVRWLAVGRRHVDQYRLVRPLAPEREALFYARVAALTGGDKAKPVVVFCHVECWGSWNAGKRLVQKGYTGVRWFPQGVEGWQELHETANLKVDPDWATGAEPQAGR